LGYTEEASAAVFTQSYQEYQRTAVDQEPSYRVQGDLTDWYTGLADSQMPVTSTLLDQAHKVIERKQFAMKGFTIRTGASRRFCEGWLISTTSYPINQWC
jgi:hypothetical protein